MAQPDPGLISRGTAATRAPGERRAVKSVSVLGATGSVGASTLDLIERHPDAFEVIALTAHAKSADLARLAIRHRARLAVIADPAGYSDLKARLSGSGIEVAAGPQALIEAAARPADCVVGAIMGAAGLEPMLAAVAQGRRIALANKECLVSAGQLFMAAVAASGAELLPVDSEHSAAFQALAGHDRAGVERITLTASGGPFRTWTAAAIAKACPEDALRHPNWSMGRKITIDSATLMNKGLELIEAHYLFALPQERIEIVVHPQSIIHALVEYADGSTLAQLANPDMRTPIALALSWPARMAAPTPRLDLVALANLTFEAPDHQRFPALGIARSALAKGGTAPAALNAANEIAVESFLAGRIGFHRIAQIVARSLEILDARAELAPGADLAGVLHVDGRARSVATELVGRER